MKFLKDESGFGNIVYGAVGLVVFLILISSVVMPVVMGVNQTLPAATCGPYANVSCTWPVAYIALWGIIPIVVVASVILFVIGKK